MHQPSKQPSLACPECGGEKLWKDGLRYSSNGDLIQRWLCSDAIVRKLKAMSIVYKTGWHDFRFSIIFANRLCKMSSIQSSPENYLHYKSKSKTTENS